MSEEKSFRQPDVGKLRPSQVVTQHGPGAIVDLPEVSVVMAGINHWFTTGEDRVMEPRLERFLNVTALYRPPYRAKGKAGGLPSFIFPEWLVCPRCRYLGKHEKFNRIERWKTVEFRCPRSSKEHGKSTPTAFPARFLVACAKGHLDDFPWWDWVHRGGGACSGQLELIDTGNTGSASDLLVKCTSCDRTRGMGEAFEKGIHPECSRRRPWLSLNDHDTECGEAPKTILRGASNAYFSVVASALSIPPWSDPIHQDLARYRESLQTATSLEKLKVGLEQEFYDLGDLPERYTVEAIWKALNAEPEVEEDLRRREWDAFRHPGGPVEPGTEFEVRERSVPVRYESELARVVAATRLREVRALRGFTRIDSVQDFGEQTDVSELDVRVAPIRMKEDRWLPGIDFRGEGIFIEFSPDALVKWESQPSVVSLAASYAARFSGWAEERDREKASFPGMRYVLIHSFAHSFIRQLALDCGYSSSALRERIYCSTGDQPMAGVLIYTATSDSDGSLGGLVDQAVPDRLGPLLMDGLRDAAYCAQDPLCGGGDIGAAAHLNGAACHACLLLAETSCENGNRLLDRSVLVPTLIDHEHAYFAGS